MYDIFALENSRTCQGRFLGDENDVLRPPVNIRAAIQKFLALKATSHSNQRKILIRLAESEQSRSGKIRSGSFFSYRKNKWMHSIEVREEQRGFRRQEA